MFHNHLSALCFVAVSASQLDEARCVFGGLGVQVVTGHRYLGGFIGDCGLRQEFVLDCMDQWCKHIETLSAVAASQPQAAFSAMTKSLQFEWTFIMRVIRDYGPLFSELENCCHQILFLLCLELRCLWLNGSFFHFH